MYLATGQDVANIGESNQCTTYQRATSKGDFYFSITLPAVIMATYGGGTALPTQRECLRMLGCEGKGKALKLCGNRGGVGCRRRTVAFRRGASRQEDPHQ
ncbi:MAG: hypothetical protein CM15mP25_5930 [Gammaproteobacteria bacterium]|nr:MAG: hypothetical protein CM15mP25_5930 [Gammaproteobacteria bacterium]